jgi:hypothetical protein
VHVHGRPSGAGCQLREAVPTLRDDQSDGGLFARSRSSRRSALVVSVMCRPGEAPLACREPRELQRRPPDRPLSATRLRNVRTRVRAHSSRSALLPPLVSRTQIPSPGWQRVRKVGGAKISRRVATSTFFCDIAPVARLPCLHCGLEEAPAHAASKSARTRRASMALADAV